MSLFWAASGFVSTNVATPDPDKRQHVRSKKAVKEDNRKREIKATRERWRNRNNDCLQDHNYRSILI